MPYTMDKPPDAIKALPKHGKEIWIAAYNSAWDQYDGDEAKCAATAWAAVKNSYEKDGEGNWRAKAAADLSLDRIRDMLWQAVRDRFPIPPDNPNAPCAYLREVFPGFLVYEFDAKLFRLGWSILDGEAKLGENPVEVEQQWVEIRSAQAESDEGVELLMRLGAAKDPEGAAWDVTICEAGPTKNGWYIPDEALRTAADEKLFENVDVNLYELPQGASHLPDPLFDLKTLLVKNKVGWIDGVKHAAGVGL